MSHYETGTQEPPFGIAMKLAKALRGGRKLNTETREPALR
jgi:hypothetical protein